MEHQFRANNKRIEITDQPQRNTMKKPIDVGSLLKKRQLNVAEQNAVAEYKLLQAATWFRTHQHEIPQPIRVFWESHSIDLRKAIDFEYEDLSAIGLDGHYGGLLVTSDKCFWRWEIVLDETREKIVAIEEWHDVTGEQVLSARMPGTGKGRGSMCLEILAQLNAVINPWQRMKHLFEIEDGSLPDIYVEDLSNDEIVDLYEWLMTQCEIARNPKLWSIEMQKNVPIRDVSRPAKAFVEGKVETFRHCLAELQINGIELPELSVSLEPNGISFDYRTGTEWTEQTAIALLELLRQMLLRAPRSRIFQTGEGAHEQPNIEFSEAFRAYVGRADT